MTRRLLAVLPSLFLAAAGSAIVVPGDGDSLRQREFRHPDLDYGNLFRPPAALPLEVSRSLTPQLAGLGVDPGNAYYDLRTGRWGTLILSQPLVPGPGVGNDLTWTGLGRNAPHSHEERAQAVAEVFRDYLSRNTSALRIDTDELAEPAVTLHGERLALIHVGRRHQGIPVRGAYLKATINSGNLVLLGLRNWGDLTLDPAPGIASGQAEQSLRRHLGPAPISGYREVPRLEILPVSNVRDETLAAPGAGLQYRLAWVLTPTFADDRGTWEALVDAHTGEVLAFQDLNQYASREVKGGIYPVSNDGAPPDGQEQSGFPMPFADLALDGDAIGFTDTGGNAPACSEGTLATTLAGRFVRMNDNCGPINETSASGDLDLGDGPGTDCEIPEGDHSPGDTHASRTGFYELNRLVEQARGYLPDNAWLDQQLTANMNIDNTCNAFWNGSTVNFYRSGGGCGNTGEIAAIFDHEWGHGLDDNDANGALSSPGESIADIIAQNRLNDSCIGRGFRLTGTCGGYGDPCLTCTGVRDSDWAGRASDAPHDIDWILSPTDLPGGGCVGVVGTSQGPCLQETHCEGTIVAEAAWDLVHRDLQGFEGSPFDLDLNTALEIGTRLSLLGSSNVGNWYQCTPVIGGDGCNADGGYLNFLAVDDDNGNLEDGTPHMSAIFAAFDRHQLACPSPAVQDAGCSGGPATAPANVVATPLDKGVHLSWDAVPGASEYWIYRTEGVKGCDFGKAKVGETTATEFAETGLANGFDVLYSVVAVGASDACTSPMSACQAVAPQAGPSLALDPAPLEAQEVLGGDGDASLDNCEVWSLALQVNNTGSDALTNVRLVDIQLPSHPEVQVVTELPATLATSVAECGLVDGEILIRGGGLGFDDTLEVVLTVTSDELDPVTVSRSYTLGGLESDMTFFAERRFTFEADLEGWELVQGTFDRTDVGGGGDGTTFYVASSSLLDDQCDQIRSPLIELTQTSTLELFNQFEIEPMSDAFFDRANVGLFDPQSGSRTVVSPDGGRLYNASGPNGACVTGGQPGWAAAGPAWLASTWTAEALGSATQAGEARRLDVAYGTDPLVSGTGFWFDEVTLTDAFVQEGDGQPDACPAVAFVPTALSVDAANNGVFEAGESPVVAPSWGNAGAQAAALTGSGDSFSGPGDSSYTIVDEIADYGSLDVGLEASCEATGNCYTLSLGVPSTRPVRHWDAIFDESLSSSNEKSWLLHIGESFSDVPTSGLFYRFIETIFHHGVTSGCDATEYCSGSSNTRAQMAVFLLRGLEGPDYVPPECSGVFADVDCPSLFADWIEDLAAREITAGCGGDNYCPSNPVSRAQMAVFLLRALEGSGYTPPECSGVFADVSCPSLFADWIEDLAAREITSGCGDGVYCPGDAVTRGQMGVFLTRTFGLTLYGP